MIKKFPLVWQTILIIVLVMTAVIIAGIVLLQFGLGGETVTVPDIIGKDLSEALEMANKQGLNLKILEKRFNNRVPSGIIITQIPAGGESVRKSRAVKVVVSLGTEMVTAPNVVGMPIRQAQMILRKAGLDVGWESSVHQVKIAKDYVIAQAVAPNSEVKRQTRISLLVSLGAAKNTFIMPDFIGHNLTSVSEQLKELGLELGIIAIEKDSRFKPGTIIKQEPPLGSRIAKGSTIDFTVAQLKDYAGEEKVHFSYSRDLRQLKRAVISSEKSFLLPESEGSAPRLKNWKQISNEVQDSTLDSLR